MSVELLEPRILLSTDTIIQPHILWAPDTPDEIVAAALASESELPFAEYQFTDTNRWSSTSTDGSGLNQGDPTTLTWSLVPDGTSIYGYNGEATSNSNLIAFMVGIYGGDAGLAPDDPANAAWFDLFVSVFDRWSELTGLNYVYEPNDDGSAWTSTTIDGGQAGVRGDVRISGHNIDGNSGTLAYNFFPNFGDMVIDTGDNFYSTISSNSLRLRNVLAHEAGHGFGLDHVMPVSQTKLMEPFASTAFNGPQFDDILAAQRGYGDDLEESGGNDTFGSATTLGDISNSSVTRGNILTDANALIMSGEALSIDDDSDTDFFSFTVTANQDVTITLSPEGYTYLSGPQTSPATTPTDFNAAAQSNLTLSLLNTNGTSVLVTANATGAGAAEIINYSFAVGGMYFVRITGDANAAQMYQLDMSAVAAVPTTLSGTVFDDTDGDGNHDGGEPGLSGWTVFLDEDDDGVLDIGGTVQQTFNATDVGQQIGPDADTVVNSTLDLSGVEGTITDLNLTFDITHSWDADIVATLISPEGTRVLLVGNEGGNANNFTGTTFDDEAGTSITSGSAPFSGTYRPEEPLSNFDGESVTGIWTLEIVDTTDRDQGTLNSWSIDVTLDTPSEQSTTTDVNGDYSFIIAASGNYAVTQVLQAPYVQTAPVGGVHDVSVTLGSSIANLDFGNQIPGSNTAPVANDDPGYSTDEDTILNVAAPGVLANDTDDDFDTLTVDSYDATSTLGAAITMNADGSFSYDPTGSATLGALNNGDSLNDTFTYTIADGNGGFDTATVTVAVDGVTDVVPPDITSDLVTHWTFNEGTGSTAADTGSAGTVSDTGTLAGGAGWSTAGLSGALDTPSGGRVDVANSDDINLAATTSSYTVSLWFYADATTGRQVLYEQGGTGRGLNIYLDGDQLYVGGWNSTPTGWAGTYLSTTVTSEQWHHVALTLDGGASVAPDALIGYLNGVEFDRGEGSQVSTHTGSIGIAQMTLDTRFHDGDQTGDGYSYAGLLDDIRIYQRALASNDIAALAAESPVNPVPNTDPVANDDPGYSTDEDTILNVAAPGVLANDTDDDFDTLTVDSYDATSTLGAAVTMNADGSFSYDPTSSATLGALNNGDSLNDTFTYTISDGNGGFDTATVTVAVDGVTDATSGATLPYYEDFTDGIADDLTGLSGSWTVSGGRYNLASAGGDSVAVLDTASALPAEVEFSALVTAGTPGGGLYSNAGLIFDYQSATDFKYVLGSYGNNKILVGQRTGAGWQTQLTINNISLSAGALREFGVIFDNTGAVEVFIDGGSIGTHNFASDLTDGQVGMATSNSNASYDNVSVQEPDTPPPPTGGAELPYFEDFADGIADDLTAVSGSWIASGGRYNLSSSGGDSVAVLQTADPLPTSVLLSALVTAGAAGGGLYSNAGLIFDYQSATNFKYVLGSYGNNKILVGQRTGAGWQTQLTINSVSLTAGALREFGVIFDDTGAVEVFIDGASIGTHNFATDLTDGQVGMATSNSNATYDNLTVQASDTPPPPAGGAELPYFEDFTDGIADDMTTVSGSWLVSSGRYNLTTQGGDSVAVLETLDPLPSEVEFSAMVTAGPGGGGKYSNAGLVFDYQSATDFKYVLGAYPGDAVVIGQRTVSGWQTQTTITGVTLDPGTLREFEVIFDSVGNVEVFIDGGSIGTHNFASDLTDGQVGLVTSNSDATFDNVSVQDTGTPPPPGATLPYSEDFGDGTADFMTAIAGVWTVSGGVYNLASQGGDSVSVLLTDTALPSEVDFSAMVTAGPGGGGLYSNAGLIFDYQSGTDFKYVLGAYPGDVVVIGHRTVSGWQTQATITGVTLDPGTLREFGVVFDNVGNVEVFIDNVSIGTHNFATDLTDGQVGLATSNSDATYDDLSVQAVPAPIVAPVTAEPVSTTGPDSSGAWGFHYELSRDAVSRIPDVTRLAWGHIRESLGFEPSQSGKSRGISSQIHVL